MDAKELLQRGVVRVLKRDGSLVGTGFFIGPDVVLTCAHVVRQAEASDLDPALELEWRTTLLKGDVDPVYWREKDRGDIALVKLSGPLPGDALPLPLSSWRGSGPQTLLGWGFPQYDGKFTEAKVVGGENLPDAEGVRFLQTRAGEVRKGFSGAPLYDETRGCVVAMVRDRDDDGSSAFGLSLEMIAELLVAARGGVCHAAVANLIEQVSASLPPRAGWPGTMAVRQPALEGPAAADLVALLARSPALAADSLAALLVRLPALPMPDPSTTSTAVAWAGAIVKEMSTQVDGLAIVAAALHESHPGDPTTAEFDGRVNEVLGRTVSEVEVRKAVERLERAALTSEKLRSYIAECAPDLPLDGYGRAAGHEAIWAVRFLSNVRPVEGKPSPLERLFGCIEGKVAPRVAAAQPAVESVLLVSVAHRQQGYASKIWGVVGSKKKKLHDDGDQATSLDEIRKRVDACWPLLAEMHPVPPNQAVFEFILPRCLICHDVENWKVTFGRRPHPLAGQCRVVVRSWERLFEHSFRSTWGAWGQKWMLRAGTAHRIEGFARKEADRIFDMLGQPDVSMVVLGSVPDADARDEDDIVSMCVSAGIPIALWPRNPEVALAGPGGVIPVGVPADFNNVPEGLRQARAAAIAKPSGVGYGWTLLWDSAERLPPDLEIDRENINQRDGG